MGTSALKQKFKVGDKVKPKEQWIKAPTPPSGEVTRIEPCGNGQWIFVGTYKRAFLAGCYELDEASALESAAALPTCNSGQ